ncbi:MAG: pantetheine-phosphate adenylyltransferase [Aerococcaceae bacterium]|nr:pantetheine-phosphate adenylyltransferase [Aerococcaceae bacterium]
MKEVNDMTQGRVAIFPGSFDPLTNGHLNLIERSSKLFDEVIVLIATNTSKQYLFSLEERRRHVTEAVATFPNVSVDVLNDTLVVHYARSKNVQALIRGVRNTLDFEYEHAIAVANRQQDSTIETVLLYADASYRHLSSSLIKEVARFGGSLDGMVPPTIEVAIKEKIQ